MNVARLLCHGREERCFSIKGYQLPICARCTGIYVGFISALLFEIYIGLPSIQALPILIIAGIPSAIDGVTQLLTERESNNLIRVITGLSGGFGLLLCVRIIRVYLTTIV